MQDGNIQILWICCEVMTIGGFYRHPTLNNFLVAYQESAIKMQLKKGLIMQQAQLKKRTDELLTNGSKSSQKLLEEGSPMNRATTKGHSVSSIF
jgi:hypothetical protein